MRISEDLVVQNVGGDKLVLVQDSTRAEMMWPIGDMIANQQLAETLDAGFAAHIMTGESIKVQGYQALGAGPMVEHIEMDLIEYGRFVFAAGYLIGASR